MTTLWPADKVERRPVAELVPYARNSRLHSAEQIDTIAGSIREWGWTTPVLVSEDRTIIAGHARVLAAQKLGLVEIPVMVAVGWTEAQIRAYVIADNRIPQNSTWDDDLLRVELQDLLSEGFDLKLAGFEESDLLTLMAEPEPGGDGDGEANEADPSGKSGAGSLAARFGIPPFSVLNAREGWWQDRKRAWLALGIKSEEGRGEGNECAPGGGGGIWGHGGPSDVYAKPAKAKANAEPGGPKMPSTSYSKNKARGDGKGRPV